MREFKTTLDGDSVTVEITDDNHVHVSSDGDRIWGTWGFTPDLKPEFLQRPNTENEMAFRFDGNRIFSSISAGRMVSPEQEVTTKTSSFLASFGKALDAISLVSKQPSFPRAVREKISAAYERLDIAPGGIGGVLCKKEGNSFHLSSQDSAAMDRAEAWVRRFKEQDEHGFAIGLKRHGNTLEIRNPGSELLKFLMESAREQTKHAL